MHWISIYSPKVHTHISEKIVQTLATVSHAHKRWEADTDNVET